VGKIAGNIAPAERSSRAILPTLPVGFICRIGTLLADD
jgi:hypothetical protein